MKKIHDENDVMIGWKAYYPDKVTYASDKYKWVDIPVEDFQYLKIYYDRNTDSWGGLDMYIITEDPDEIKRLVKEDIRNIKIGKRIDGYVENQKWINKNKEKITVII